MTEHLILIELMYSNRSSQWHPRDDENATVKRCVFAVSIFPIENKSVVGVGKIDETSPIRCKFSQK